MAKMKFRTVVDRSPVDQAVLEARHELWRMGDLSWKLRGKQIELYNDIIDQTKDVSVGLCSRRFGKSTTTLVPCIEECIANPDIIVKYACPTQKMVKKMIYPALKVIFADAPPEYDLEKLWNGTEGELRFPNGSLITIAGTDGNNADNLRGAYAHIVVADEAAFMDDLEYVIKQILLPQTDTTGGKIIMLSTPNYYNPKHEFHTEYVFPYEASGKLIKFTLFDSPMVNDKERERIINRYKKKLEDPRFKCEYLVEIPKVSEATIVPEFYLNRKSIISTDMVIPSKVAYYVGGDVGQKDLTAYIFGYYDHTEGVLNILDEYVENGDEMTTKTIADAIKLKEEQWFKDSMGANVLPFKRVMDNNLQMVADFRKLHGLNFIATKKDKKIAQVNNLRVLIEEGRLKIHPRCQHLIYHVENAQWKDGKGLLSEFDHLTDSIDGDIKGGHADALDALLYLVRNINYNFKPKDSQPKEYNENQYQSTANAPVDNVKNMMKKMTGNTKKGKKYG